jgi:FlaA1/EpsC-like NDP-sugar epimerase
MLGMRTDRQRLAGLVFAFIDCSLILISLLLSIYLRFSGFAHFFSSDGYSILKVISVVLVIQLSFYYFDLYDPSIFSDRKKMFILCIASLVASSVVMAIVYYLIRSLVIGRGVFFITLLFVLISCFLSRLLYGSLFRLDAFRERVLVLGTGPLAKKIESELTNNGYHGFEIVGFIDEHGKTVNKSI